MSSVVRTTTGMTMTASAIGAGPSREVAHGHDHHAVDEQADDDRRRAQQDVVDEADRLAPARCRAPYSAR